MSHDQVIAECREALTALERALFLPPVQTGKDAELATRAAARARDLLIERLRGEEERGEASDTRDKLNRVNAALSLMIGVQFPVAAVDRKMIEQAHAALQSILQ